MGELFKHFEGWDVQALRREIKEAKGVKYSRTAKCAIKIEKYAVRQNKPLIQCGRL